MTDKAFESRPIQHALERSPVDADLRHLVASISATCLVPHDLSTMGHVDQTRSTDADPVQGWQHTEHSKLLDGVRQHVDADAELAHFSSLLEYLGRDYAATLAGPRAVFSTSMAWAMAAEVARVPRRGLSIMKSWMMPL